MSATSFLGNADTDPYIKLTHKGVDYFYPLVRDEEDRVLGGGDINTSTLESFSPSSIAGDPSLVSNELLAVLLWSNFQRGMGTVKYQEQEGTGSLDSFAYATLDTRFQGMAILPPKRISLGTLPNNRPNIDFLLTYDGTPYATGTTVWRALAWDTGTGIPNGGQCHALTMNAAGTVATWTAVGMAGLPTTVYQVISFGGLFVIATNLGIYTAANGGATTLRWTGRMLGLCVHDNKLYGYNANDGKLYWTLDPTTGAAWTNSSIDPLKLGPGEYFVKMVEWKNRQDTRSLFILTNRKIVAFDDDGYWAGFYEPDAAPGDSGDMVVWVQDRSLYFAPRDLGNNVLQFQNQTISNISPNKRGGIPKVAARIIARLRGTFNFLYGEGRVAVPPLNPLGMGTATWTTTYGQVMAYNGQGWHTLVEGASGATVANMAVARDQVIFTRNGVNVETVFVADAPQSPLYANGPVNYAEGTFYLESADADAGLENIYKTARFFEIVLEGSDGTLGLPANHLYSFDWQIEGGAWMSLAANVGPGGSKFIRLPATTPTITDSRGVAFYTCRWRFTLVKSVGADATVTPILRSVALYYLRAPDLIDGIQFGIDLSPLRVEQIYNAMGATYNGMTVELLKDTLMAIKVSKYNPRIEYGPLRHRTVIPAAEIRVSARENPLTGQGQYIVTARDVSTKTVMLA